MEDERKGLPSASSIDADIRCLGRRALVRHLPNEATKWTTRGDKIHSVLEGEMEMEELADSDKYTASAIMNEEARLVDEHHFQGAEIFSEQRLWAMGPDMEPIYSGKMDRLHKLGDRGLLIDYKTGWTATVPLANNWQMRTNAALIYANKGVKTVKAVVIHPHHPSGEVSEEIEYTQAQLEAFVIGLEEVTAQMTDDAPRTPNAVSCQWCQAKKICPEYQKQMATVLKEDGSLTARPQFETMTPEQRGDRLRLLVMVQKSIEDEKECYKAMLKINAESVTGWWLKPGGHNRDITDDQEAKTLVNQAFTQKFGAETGEKVAEECMKFGLTKFENILKARGMAKKEASNYANTLLANVIMKKYKEASLAEKN